MSQLLAALAAITLALPSFADGPMRLIGTDGFGVLEFSPDAPIPKDLAVLSPASAYDLCPPYTFVVTDDCDECQVSLRIFLPMSAFNCGGCSAWILTDFTCDDPEDNVTKLTSIPNQAPCDSYYTKDYPCPGGGSTRIAFGCYECIY